MRIIQISAGTGNFYCGSCLRDHAAVKGLAALGHDTQIVPLYLPLVTETPSNGDVPMFFGGINVYLQQKSALFRHTPGWFDRVLDSTVILKLAARNAGMTKAHELGELTLATLQVQDSRQRKELRRLIDWLASTVRPDVICLSNALLTGFAKPIREAIDVPVVCTLQGEDAFLDGLPAPYDGRCWEALRENVADVAGFIAVSKYYGDVMRKRMALDAARAHVVYNGIELDDFKTLNCVKSAKPVIGYLTQIIPGKGGERLVDAFISLKRENRVTDLQLHIAGSLVPAERPFLKRLEQKVEDAGFADDLQISTNIDRATKLAFLGSLSVLSVPATYGESFGLYVIEALAAGVPVVQPRHAAFPEVIEMTGGGILCEPDNTRALADALASLLLDPVHAAALGEHGKRVVFEEFGVDRMCRELADVFNQVIEWHTPSK
jgi:glycosyltransferase involved in cell wall biosynthesis